eukprot:4840453-Pleurochrysis_carterae.AAC.1
MVLRVIHLCKLNLTKPDEIIKLDRPRDCSFTAGAWHNFTGIDLRMDDESQRMGDIPGSRKFVIYRYAMRKRVAYVSDPLYRPYGKSPVDTRERLIPVMFSPGKTEGRFLSLRGPGQR